MYCRRRPQEVLSALQHQSCSLISSHRLAFFKSFEKQPFVPRKCILPQQWNAHLEKCSRTQKVNCLRKQSTQACMKSTPFNPLGRKMNQSSKLTGVLYPPTLREIPASLQNTVNRCSRSRQMMTWKKLFKHPSIFHGHTSPSKSTKSWDYFLWQHW